MYYVCTYACMCLCLFVCMLYVHVCVCVCVCVYTYVLHTCRMIIKINSKGWHERSGLSDRDSRW